MSKKSKKKSVSRFKRGFTVYKIILCLLFAGALAVLWQFLDRYQGRVDEDARLVAEEQARVIYERDCFEAPQLCFEEFVSAADTEYWVSKWYEANPGSLDERGRMTEELARIFDPANVQLFKAEDFTQEEPEYVLRSGDTRLATVSLKGNGLEWAVDKVEFLLNGSESARVEVPTGCTVYCNGVALGNEFKAETHSYFDSEDIQDKLQNPIEWSVYAVEGQYFAPELSAEAPADRTLYTTEDGITGYMLSADEAAAYQRKGEKFVKDLLYYYYQGGSNTWANMAVARDQVMGNSPAYYLLQQSADGVYWDTTYNNATFEATAQSVIIWADNCMSMDVVYHAEGSVGGISNPSDGTYRLYFMNLGNGFGIYKLSSV